MTQFEALITGDDQLAAEATRLAEAAGVPLRRFATLAEAATCFGPGRLVLIGADLGGHGDGELARARGSRPVRLAFGSAGGTEVSWSAGNTGPASHPGSATAGFGGVADISTLYLPGDGDRLLRLLEMGPSAGARCTLGILGTRGGIGVSVLAAAIAREVARAGPSTLIDLDMSGGGMDVLLGIEDEAGQRWPDLHGRANSSGIDLPSWRGVRVLSAGRSASEPVDRPAVHRIVRQLAAHGTTIVDIGRGAGGIDPIRAACWCQRAIVVTSIDTVSIAGAGVLLRRLADCEVDVRLVTCDPAPTALRPAHVAEMLDRPVLTHLRRQRGLAAWLEHGGAPGDGRRTPVAATARAIVGQLLAGNGEPSWPS